MVYVRILVTSVCAAVMVIGVMATGIIHSTFPQHSLAALAANAQDEAAGFDVGDTLPADQIHIVTKPGLYGLGPEPPESKYAVAHGKLIRIDPKTGQVLSILRNQAKILD